MNAMPKTLSINVMALNSAVQESMSNGQKRVDDMIQADTNQEVAEEIIVAEDDHQVGLHVEGEVGAEVAVKVVAVVIVVQEEGVLTEEILIVTLVDLVEAAAVVQEVEIIVVAVVVVEVPVVVAGAGVHLNVTVDHHPLNIRRGKNKIIITTVITTILRRK